MDRRISIYFDYLFDEKPTSTSYAAFYDTSIIEVSDQNNNLANFNKELFKFQLKQQALKRKDKKLKLKKTPNQLPPITNEKTYAKEIRNIINQFIQVTIQEIKPLLREWNRQNRILVGDYFFAIPLDSDYDEDNYLTQDLERYNLSKREDESSESFKKRLLEKIRDKGYKVDDPSDDLNEIDKEWERLRTELFGEGNENNLNDLLFTLGIGVGVFNQKQWQKSIKGATGAEFIIQEPWEEPVLRAWVNRNVNLIRGLTDEYRKKIRDTVLQAFEQGTTAEELAKQLTNINKNFSTGGFKIVKGKKVRKQSRAMLIARDQINKLNGIYSRRRQLDAGVDWYRWHTAADERVRSTHKPLHNKICRWDNPTVYADSIEDAKAGNWKSRSAIGAVQLHPGQDIQCRCFGEAIFIELVEEVNNE